jgi:general L-amino acid transport system permease protein
MTGQTGRFHQRQHIREQSMTTLSDPPQGGFRLSMLINDTRYRSYTFQFIALIALIVAFGYLGSNLIANLKAAGLNISYRFLGEPAGYDINQRLIEYTSQSSHMRAAVVGMLNTLLVAVVACFLATIIGVIVGVLRLSNNWIVNKLMGVYVEIFRNVPVLIWILIIMAVFVAVLPQPREFRGDDATASMFLDLFAFTGRGFYFPRPTFICDGDTRTHGRTSKNVVFHLGNLVGSSACGLRCDGAYMGASCAQRLQLQRRHLRA